MKKLKSWTLANCGSDDVIVLVKDANSEILLMIFENILIWTSYSNQKTALHYAHRFTIGWAQVEKKHVNGILNDMSFEIIPKKISN